ncbi:MAG: aminopeptidase P N-terminal domain-containing protein [Burkholderiaceae bacterium]|nr:aminopeptidase P N-terminal domain-containing protein [Burkholderiaceae bacterium]
MADAMRARGGGVAIAFTAPEVARNRDSDYPYRWDSYFHYLTGFPEPEAAMALVVDDQRVEAILFCRERNEEREIWDGFRFGPQAARERFGFDRALPFASLDEEMPRLLADRPALWYALGSDERLDARIQRWLGAVRAQARAGVAAPAQAFDLRAVLDEMRLVKDEYEIATMRHAARISAAAHVRAMRATRPGCHEYEIEAELLHEFRRNGSQFPAYGSIVAGGRNACVLHYRGNDARLVDGELLLIDAGCELDGYASDITRTFPVGGRFSGPQRTLYEIVLEAQRAAIDATRPGARFIDPHDAAVRVLAQGMIDCGLIEGTLDGAIESGAYRRFYMHRTGHWLGMDVHDCGDYREPGAAPAAARASGGAAGASGLASGNGPANPSGTPADNKPWRVLVPGMVLTVEPGLYVRAAGDVPAAFHDIGIRIEDDALVTPTGCEILTSDAPKQVDDIEALMRG